MLETPRHRGLLHQVEVVYAAITLFALTQGPVYQLWSNSNSLPEFSSLSSPAHVHLATFLVLQLPGALLWSRRVDSDQFRDRSFRALILLHVWLGATVVWSTLARHSLPEVVALVVTTMFGLYLAESFSRQEFWWIIAGAMSLGLGFSWWSITRLWEGAVNFQMDYWQGIYGNRNSLAPVAGVAILAVFGIASEKIRKPSCRQSTDWPNYVFVLSVLLTSSVFLWQSGSQTSPTALGISVIAVLMRTVIKAIGRRFPTAVRFLKSPTQLTLVVLGFVTFFTLQLIGRSSAVSSDIATFNSRRALWSVNWSGFLEKPMHGWGWMAARVTPDFFKQGTWWAAPESQWAHNGYHDLLLGGGALAVVLFGFFVLGAARGFDSSYPSETTPLLALTVFVLTAAIQESFFVGSHFLWALLIAALMIRCDDGALVQKNRAS